MLQEDFSELDEEIELIEGHKDVRVRKLQSSYM